MGDVGVGSVSARLVAGVGLVPTLFAKRSQDGVRLRLRRGCGGVVAAIAAKSEVNKKGGQGVRPYSCGDSDGV